MPTYEPSRRLYREFDRLTAAQQGRATFTFGGEGVAGYPHVIWRRIGDHSIFRDP